MTNADPSAEQRQSIDSLAVRQQQIVTRSQLLAAGFDDMHMYRQTRRGRWQRVLPATYALVTGTLTDEQRLIAAVLYVGRSGQLTGPAALRWYGFRYAPKTPETQLIVPHDTRRASAGHVRVCRTLSLDDRARDGGLYQVCSPARAVVDTSRDLRDLRMVRAIVAEAIQRSYTDLRALDEEVVRAGRSRTALVRRAFQEVVQGTRSAPEAELRACLSNSRLLPEIIWNPRLLGPDRSSLPTPDGYLADAAIALEVDSQEFHFAPADWHRTMDRHNELSRHGLLILHFPPAQIRREPHRVRQIVEDAYRSRRGFGARCGVLLGGAPATAESDKRGPFLTPGS
ncbi:type IV toxin-antitoxin system AbiEi family antitoxin domain-containing protein [Micromonospora sp. WMMD1102]|uniref:type IV toxin-antitoxin system AbiEi family antitoxin domain-containing protein n=1 Tax=Micromonospora sp. WMMD1102 TaxID=3016105 RepID=UPI00241542D0|nr:type IV toxin-antitoxin system AbiEi family antitoxin domain-containing protein [Micromonospora sp. WMMD1102]MDG4789188.1 type IV toxin-antitoxin system AbiEi family antitoxin domain-containing protein [Micromonospora sp. WMMD1102]